MHGGISPDLKSLQQLRTLRRPFIDPPCPSLELDLMWADPSADISGTATNTRGVSILFGPDVVADVVKRLDIDLIVRAHQVGNWVWRGRKVESSCSWSKIVIISCPFQCVHYGAEFFADAYLLTLFTAPNYQDEHNIGALLLVGQMPKMPLSFRFLRKA